MKFALMTIGLFSIFHAVFSLKCYSCNAPEFDFNDKQCTHITQVECHYGAVCAKMSSYVNGENYVAKGCRFENSCQGDEFTENIEGVDITTNCCKNNYCNGSENVFQNKVVLYTFFLTAILKLFF